MINCKTLENLVLSGTIGRRTLLACLFGAVCLMGSCSDDSAKNQGKLLENTEALCSDGIDNDNNGIKDCDEPDCAWFAVCVEANRENTLEKCTDGRDNDMNGLTDCEEDDCVMFAQCQTQLVENTPERCKDGKDNDRNGDADCADANCQALEVCSGIQPENTEALCSDGVDNDNNGVADCKDANCLKFSSCQKPENTEELCSDGLDNDNNGVRDCDESSCKGFAHCKSGPQAPCGGVEDTCVGNTRKYCDGDDIKTEYCPLGCKDAKCTTCEDNYGPSVCEDGIQRYCPDTYSENTDSRTCLYGCNGSRCKTCEEEYGPESCSYSRHLYCPDDNAAQVAEHCDNGCDGNKCKECIPGPDYCDKSYSRVIKCTQDEAGNIVAKYEECPTGICIVDKCEQKEDNNGNHMIDAWENSASHDRGEKFGTACKTDKDCDGESFCDHFIGQCSVQCIGDYECMDGFVCRKDGRCASEAFITEWRPYLDSKENKNLLKLDAAANSQNQVVCEFTIDWGDGKTEEITDCAQLVHVYPDTTKNYTITMKGEKLSEYSFIAASGLKKVLAFGPVQFLRGAFVGARVEFSEDIDIPDLSDGYKNIHIFYMDEMFKNATISGSISKWDVSDVSHMLSTFENASGTVDLGKWDVSHVEYMISAFARSSFVDPNLNAWDVSSVTVMNSMFAGAGFDGKISDWDVSSVTSMSSMFENDINFEQDMPNWNTGKVFYMDSMFSGAKAFNGNISGWDVSNVIRMNKMFYNAVKFNSDISNWNVSSVEDFSNMFEGATRFSKDLSKWPVSKATNMTAMFKEAKSFNSDISSWRVAKVRYFEEMFYNAESFNCDLSSGGWGSLYNASTMKYMFYGAKSFNGKINWYLSDEICYGSTNMYNMFRFASALDVMPAITTVSNATCCPLYRGMFYGTKLCSDSHSDEEFATFVNRFSKCNAASFTKNNLCSYN